MVMKVVAVYGGDGYRSDGGCGGDQDNDGGGSHFCLPTCLISLRTDSIEAKYLYLKFLNAQLFRTTLLLA